jgi:hypothetical protein
MVCNGVHLFGVVTKDQLQLASIVHCPLAFLQVPLFCRWAVRSGRNENLVTVLGLPDPCVFGKQSFSFEEIAHAGDLLAGDVGAIRVVGGYVPCTGITQVQLPYIIAGVYGVLELVVDG